MRTFFRRIHLYLGLAAGLVITVTCLTGAILVFQEDIEHAWNRDHYYVQPGPAHLPLEQVVAALKAQTPGLKPVSIKVYGDPRRTIEVNYSVKEKNDTAVAKKGQKPKSNFRAFVNPYTGEVIQSIDTKNTFFYKTLSLHRWLLSEDKGKIIVGISTLVFCFIIITGIILWWPTSKNMRRQRLMMGSSSSTKRLNYQWHTVLGFYSAFFLFSFAFTGLAWAFKWFNNGIYAVTGSPLKNPGPPRSVVPSGGKPVLALDGALSVAKAQYATAVFYNVQFPKEKDDPITVQVLKEKAAHESATDMLYVDAYSGGQSGHLLWSERSSGARVRATFRPVHTAGIFGWPSRVAGFIACLMGATLPFTGYVILINRLRKTKQAS